MIWKSVIFKEWLKIRWAVAMMLLLGILVLGDILLNIRHNIAFFQAENYWYNILFQGYLYFVLLKFVPLIIGAGIAITQYFPETVNKRIKLTFHLPVNEDRILLSMHLFGFLCLLGIFIVLFCLFYLGSSIFLPAGIVKPALGTIIPWFLGGIAVYFWVSMIVLEPLWLYRFLYAAIGFVFILFFFEKTPAGGYQHMIPWIVLLTLLSSIGILFSGYRFRKGEM